MVRLAGILITLCGIGHTAGSLVMTVPHYGGQWFGWALWRGANNDLVTMTHTTAGWWFSVYSFGPLLLLVGATVLWMGVRRITPPAFVAWALVVWTVFGTVLSGFSPLVLLLVAAALLLVAAYRARHATAVVAPTAATAVTTASTPR